MLTQQQSQAEFELENSISFQMAIDSGEFELKNGYLKPINTDICDFFNHSHDHLGQSYIKPANRAKSKALVFGGTEYTLKELANYLGTTVQGFIKDKQKDYITQKRLCLPKIYDHYCLFDNNVNTTLFKVLDNQANISNCLRYYTEDEGKVRLIHFKKEQIIEKGWSAKALFSSVSYNSIQDDESI